MRAVIVGGIVGLLALGCAPKAAPRAAPVLGATTLPSGVLREGAGGSLSLDGTCSRVIPVDGELREVVVAPSGASLFLLEGAQRGAVGTRGVELDPKLDAIHDWFLADKELSRGVGTADGWWVVGQHLGGLDQAGLTWSAHRGHGGHWDVTRSVHHGEAVQPLAIHVRGAGTVMELLAADRIIAMVERPGESTEVHGRPTGRVAIAGVGTTVSGARIVVGHTGRGPPSTPWARVLGEDDAWATEASTEGPRGTAWSSGMELVGGDHLVWGGQGGPGRTAAVMRTGPNGSLRWFRRFRDVAPITQIEAAAELSGDRIALVGAKGPARGDGVSVAGWVVILRADGTLEHELGLGELADATRLSAVRSVGDQLVLYGARRPDGGRLELVAWVLNQDGTWGCL